MKNKTTFSIIIPTYNRAEQIENTLHSVLSQSYSNFEVIVVDDGSTDNTKQVIQTYTDFRIKYIYIKNSERATARNKGVALAEGDFITFLDSDDELDVNHLEIAYSTLINKPETKWFHLKYRIKSGNQIIFPNYPKKNESTVEKLFLGNYLSDLLMKKYRH